ncbi:2-oxo-3-hexenedioate decarboxylase [Methylobacterium brachiatum]|jgi:2-oxo-3-hexenedioate decarboxylase|uniref:2-oxo-3-hexenedioate decarboxylase n=1 Tax=Methylobacterium brachiatum TaxID=269660 RepID=A0AAJ1TU92_9HYPH|nr:hydratase [Methylobacterium brachiatum]MCB4801661.1 hydratase [Methylobacterium brachiatum]MDQ0544806.1 2-oxo-3-hexenedioate decarboxylase [Methylobacterium brachiatum]
MSDPVPAATHARTILAAHEHRRQIAPLTGWDSGLDLAAAYRVAEEVRRLRAGRGEKPVGRKIGFTNTTLWETYGVHAPIWGHVYDTTLHDHAALTGPVPLAALVEPRIEPEIVFGLARVPEPGMDDAALTGCLAWVAQGFEIVQSLFPGWRFAAPDTVAAFGLHGLLVLGERVRIDPDAAHSWSDGLAGFSVELLRDGVVADRGSAGNVLGGGPLAALRHLVDVLAKDLGSPPLAAGEVVTTGTLTDALPVAPGQVWTARLSGLPLPGFDLSLA